MNTVWLIVAVAFAIGELMTPSLTLVWFSIGALVLMVLSIFIENIIMESIKLEVRLLASIQKVWSSFTEPNHVQKWFFVAPNWRQIFQQVFVVPAMQC